MRPKAHRTVKLKWLLPKQKLEQSHWLEINECASLARKKKDITTLQKIPRHSSKWIQCQKNEQTKKNILGLLCSGQCVIKIQLNP